MKNCWQIATPRYLSAGKGRVKKLPQFLKELAVTRPFLIIDPQVARSKKGKKIKEEILTLGGEFFSEFTTNPTTQQVDTAVTHFTEKTFNGVIAIGGGSAIDLAKATQLVGLNGGKIRDYLDGKKGEKPFLPFIAIPTTCGTGSEGSPFAVINDPVKKKKRGIEDRNFLPVLVILDPEFLRSLDPILIASTGIDALTHVIESYISTKANALTRGAARGLLLHLKKHLENASYTKDLASLAEMMNIAFSSRLLYPRTGLTIAHALSHPLGAYTDIHHGLAVAFFLPKSFEYNYPYSKEAQQEAFELLGFRTPEAFHEWFHRFSLDTGVRQSITTYLDNKEIPIKIIAKDAMESSNIPSNPRPVTAKDLENVIEQSLIYWGLVV